jgi:hypothetical protein
MPDCSCEAEQHTPILEVCCCCPDKQVVSSGPRMREMQMQRLRMILKIDRLRRVSRGQNVRRVCVGLAVARRGRVHSLLGRDAGKVLVLVPASTPVVPIPVL